MWQTDKTQLLNCIALNGLKNVAISCVLSAKNEQKSRLEIPLKIANFSYRLSFRAHDRGNSFRISETNFYVS